MKKTVKFLVMNGKHLPKAIPSRTPSAASIILRRVWNRLQQDFVLLEFLRIRRVLWNGYDKRESLADFKCCHHMQSLFLLWTHRRHSVIISVLFSFARPFRWPGFLVLIRKLLVLPSQIINTFCRGKTRSTFALSLLTSRICSSHKNRAGPLDHLEDEDGD